MDPESLMRLYKELQTAVLIALIHWSIMVETGSSRTRAANRKSTGHRPRKLVPICFSHASQPCAVLRHVLRKKVACTMQSRQAKRDQLRRAPGLLPGTELFAST